MPVMFKAITPKALKVNEIYKAIESGAKVVEKGILKDYEATTRTWDHKVDFRAELNINPNGGVSITVDTDDEIYEFVHEGTKPHVIRPKAGKRLRFQGTYTAKTVPGVIQSKGGGASGEFHYSAGVNHPGTKARNFSKAIFAKWKPFFERAMERALAEGAKRSGHAI
jgi:hypothetical protein